MPMRIPNGKIPQFTYLGVVMNGQLDAGCPSVVDDFNPIRHTGEKAIGTGWMVAPPEEEESNWGGTTLTM